MYLKLSVAGHLTIFLTRTRGPFWSIRPAKTLWIAVLGTQAIATLIAVYGVFMAPLGWRYAGIVWGYALAWFLLNDRLKLLTYWALDRSNSQAKANVKAVDGKAADDPAVKPQHLSGAKTRAESHAVGDVAPTAQASSTPPPEAKPPLQPKPAATSTAKDPPAIDSTSAATQPEELGRQDVMAVQELERAQKEANETSHD